MSSWMIEVSCRQYMSILHSKQLPTVTYSTNGKGNSSEVSNEAGTAPPNVAILAQPAAVHGTCNLSISKRHDIPLLEPRAQVLQSQHG